MKLVYNLHTAGYGTGDPILYHTWRADGEQK